MGQDEHVNEKHICRIKGDAGKSLQTTQERLGIYIHCPEQRELKQLENKRHCMGRDRREGRNRQKTGRVIRGPTTASQTVCDPPDSNNK